MSLGGEDLRKIEELPGAFPSEDAIARSELNSSNNNNNNAATTTQGNTRTYPEHDLGAHQNVAQVGGANNSSAPSGAPGRSAVSPGAGDAPDIAEDLRSLGSGAATAIAAAAMAARDAAVAARDTAAPVVSAAADQAKQAAGYTVENAGPAASAASEQAKSAAVYTKDSAVTGATAAANTIQANNKAPTALGGGTPASNTASHGEVAPEVPGQVKSSMAQAGEGPGAAGSRRAVQDKGRVEGELLRHTAGGDAEGEARGQQQQQQQQQQRLVQPPPPGVLPRLDSGAQTPSTGVAVVLGTDTERAFPLGSHPVSTGGGGIGEQQPRSARQRPAVEDKVPVRTGEEVAVPNGPGAYNKLSSGTPSGVGQGV